MKEAIIGISAFYHDSAAVLIVGNEIIAAAQEERFTRIKHDCSFPLNAIKYILSEYYISSNNIKFIAFYEKPFLKFERLLETYHSFAPLGLKSFLSAIPLWIKEKLFIKKFLKEELAKISPHLINAKLLFPEHHFSHAASAFYPSPFENAAILTIDGVGEWSTTTISFGENENITILKELHFPHSLGLLYSAFTYYCGFHVNSGEYKLMGLASYGNPTSENTKLWKKLILDELIDLREDVSYLLNMDYFSFATGLSMCNEKKMKSLFGISLRKPETEILQEYMDLALAIQQVTEEVILRLAKTAKKITNSKNLVMAGGVALNCVANGKLLRKKIFDDIWIQPAAGDAGGALGAALIAYYTSGNKRVVNKEDSMSGAYLGPKFHSEEILKTARYYNASYKYYFIFQNLADEVANLLAQGNIIGWFQGRMEFGPRALGNRSILGDARLYDIQKRLNFNP